MITKTGKWYFKPKFWGGFDLYIEIKQTYLYGITKYRLNKFNNKEIDE